MFRIILIGGVLTLVYLFYPQYNLYEKEGSFSNEFVLRQTGFWSKQKCYKAGSTLEDDFSCRKTTAWQGMLGKQHEYNKEKPID